MLTEPHGLNFITSCEEEGFHSHPKEPPLYEVSQLKGEGGFPVILKINLQGARWGGGGHMQLREQKLLG